MRSNYIYQFPLYYTELSLAVSLVKDTGSELQMEARCFAVGGIDLPSASLSILMFFRGMKLARLSGSERKAPSLDGLLPDRGDIHIKVPCADGSSFAHRAEASEFDGGGYDTT